MILPFNLNLRVVLSVVIFLIGIAIYVINNNSKEKHQYQKSTGTIDFFDKKFQNFPSRNKNDYRYLKIDSYPFIFEIYKPNSLTTNKTIDDLKIGDIIDIYFYETENTWEEKINRYTQYIDSDNYPYFIRNNFQVQLGFSLIGLSILIIFIAFLLWKKKKLFW